MLRHLPYSRCNSVARRNRRQASAAPNFDSRNQEGENMSISLIPRTDLHAGASQRATGSGEYHSDLSRREDRSKQSVLASASTQPPSNPVNRARKKGRSPVAVAARLLGVLVVALVVTSIVGLTAVGDQINPTATVVAGVIGMSSAVLGLLFGFLKAYQSS
jgi:hypothetical protein